MKEMNEETILADPPHSLITLCRTYRIPPYTLRHACYEGKFPCETRKELVVRNGKPHLSTCHYINPTDPQFHSWFEEYKTTCLAAQTQRAQTPILALAMFAANKGITLTPFPQAYHQKRDVIEPLQEALSCIEQQGRLQPDAARAAAKGKVLNALEKGRQNGRKPELTSIATYVDMLFDQVLGTPLWERYLRFCHHAQDMYAAYRFIFCITQQEWHPQSSGDESILFEEEDEDQGDS